MFRVWDTDNYSDINSTHSTFTLKNTLFYFYALNSSIYFYFAVSQSLLVAVKDQDLEDSIAKCHSTTNSSISMKEKNWAETHGELTLPPSTLLLKSLGRTEDENHWEVLAMLKIYEMTANPKKWVTQKQQEIPECLQQTKQEGEHCRLRIIVVTGS